MQLPSQLVSQLLKILQLSVEGLAFVPILLIMGGVFGLLALQSPFETVKVFVQLSQLALQLLNVRRRFPLNLFTPCAPLQRLFVLLFLLPILDTYFLELRLQLLIPML